jgi:FkbM family methyltransferase
LFSGFKSVLFSGFQQVTRFLWGTGIGKIPGVYSLHAWLFQILQPKERIVEIQGSKMYFNPAELPKRFIPTFQSYIISGGWEELTTGVFKEVVKEGDVVVDLGANIGYYTLLAARLVGKKGKVYAFEPEPLNHGLLLKNIELNGYDNVIAVPKAVSDVSGKVKFFLDGKDTGAHSIYQPDDNKECIEIESVTLDKFFEGKNQRVNVIKMDVEGAEMAAFSGMRRIIEQNENLKVFVEFYLPAITSSGGSPQEFIRRLLEDYHFSILALGDYTEDKKYLKINNADELMSLCKGGKAANLFLERR